MLPGWGVGLINAQCDERPQFNTPTHNSLYVSLNKTLAGLQGLPVSGQPCHKEGISLMFARSASATTALAAAQYASRVARSIHAQPVYPHGLANVRAKRKPLAEASRTAARDVARVALGPPVPHAPQKMSNRLTAEPRSAVVPGGQGFASAVTHPFESFTQKSERIPGVAPHKQQTEASKRSFIVCERGFPHPFFAWGGAHPPTSRGRLTLTRR